MSGQVPPGRDMDEANVPVREGFLASVRVAEGQPKSGRTGRALAARSSVPARAAAILEASDRRRASNVRRAKVKARYLQNQRTRVEDRRA